eukprot:gene11705-biopygen9439
MPAPRPRHLPVPPGIPGKIRIPGIFLIFLIAAGPVFSQIPLVLEKIHFANKLGGAASSFTRRRGALRYGGNTGARWEKRQRTRTGRRPHDAFQRRRNGGGPDADRTRACSPSGPSPPLLGMQPLPGGATALPLHFVNLWFSSESGKHWLRAEIGASFPP